MIKKLLFIICFIGRTFYSSPERLSNSYEEYLLNTYEMTRLTQVYWDKRMQCTVIYNKDAEIVNELYREGKFRIIEFLFEEKFIEGNARILDNTGVSYSLPFSAVYYAKDPHNRIEDFALLSHLNFLDAYRGNFGKKAYFLDDLLLLNKNRFPLSHAFIYEKHHLENFMESPNSY